RRAGDRAMAALAYEEAARLYELALAAHDHSGGEDDAARRTLCANLDNARAASGGGLDIETQPTEVVEPASTMPGSAERDNRPARHGGTRAAVFRREGDYWTIVFEGRTVRLKDNKGLQYVAHLLRHPGQEFLALDLVAGTGVEGGAVCNGEPGAVLDAPAKAAYKQRLADLRDELREAEETHDLGRAERARGEMDFLVRELAAAVGLGGSVRRTGSDLGRARSAVTQGIKAAIAKIRAAHPSPGRYLARTVRTGYFCVYAPDPDEPIAWQG